MPTNFLEAPGTFGFITTPLVALSTESGFAYLINGGAVTSSVNGRVSDGIFDQVDIGNSIFGEVWFESGGSFTPVVGGYFAGWFLRGKSGDTGASATFEATRATPSITVPPVPRAPDFVIPLENAALSANDIKWAQGIVKMPWPAFKVVFWNMSGTTLPGSGSVVRIGPVSIAY